MFKNKSEIKKTISEIKKQGLYKDERVITTPQGSEVRVGRKKLLNFCANNYLGLANDKRIVNAAINGIKKYGYGLSSVRFICGTQNIHKELEKKVSKFLGTEDTILYTSCFDANTGLFETLLSKEDAVVSDALNHASIIDGIRLCKAMRFIYKHSDMQDLEEKLKEAKKAKAKKILIATDGVFSMQGDFANLPEICRLAKKYGAMVMVDDSHATGFVGPTGRGTPEYFGVQKDVDIITSTFGKALGGATGGFTSGRKEIIALLRQKSRPYLFSNSLPPVVVSASLKAIDIIDKSSGLRKKLAKNTEYFRKKMKEKGFEIIEGTHPIVAVMLYDAKLAKKMADRLLMEGIYVVGFSYPVVPKGEARIRVQISAAHTKNQIDTLVDAFERIGRKIGVLKGK
ncbi:glycine C-acetyltransferase [Candidatus Woesearchaeota archaeon]|nr:MAG: glycine C-acetyltransferase [Candidatus Woesearchaeota archaeon]